MANSGNGGRSSAALSPSPEKRLVIAGPRAVEATENGTDAWTMVARFKDRFDVVLLDVELPDIGGIELLGRLRSSAKHGGTPVLICTRENRREVVAQATGLGIPHYLIKPGDEEAICQKLLVIAQTEKSALAARTHDIAC